MTGSFEQAKKERDLLEERVNEASETLQHFPRNAMGLVPDSEKTPQYHAANTRYKTTFAALQRFNAAFTKTFAKELRAEHSARFAGYEASAPGGGRRAGKRKSAGRSKPKRHATKRRTLTRLRRVGTAKKRGYGVMKRVALRARAADTAGARFMKCWGCDQEDWCLQRKLKGRDLKVYLCDFCAKELA